MKKILKGAAWASAPKAMMAMKNPGKAAALKAGKWAVQRTRPQKKHSSMGSIAAKGFGAVVAAIPIGMWLGRQMGRKDKDELRR